MPRSLCLIVLLIAAASLVVPAPPAGAAPAPLPHPFWRDSVGLWRATADYYGADGTPQLRDFAQLSRVSIASGRVSIEDSAFYPAGGANNAFYSLGLAQAGDGVESIAVANGFFPDTIWNWSENKALKDLRGDMNILAPGDIVRVPKRRTKQEPAAAEQKHRFRRLGVPEILSVILADHRGVPFASKGYRIVIDGHVRQGTTDEAGTVTEPIPPGSRKARIIMDDGGRTYEFRLGGIDPITLPRGVSQRLHALGYDIDEDEENLRSEEASSALAKFQEDEGLEVSGAMSDATRDALKARFGS